MSDNKKDQSQEKSVPQKSMDEKILDYKKKREKQNEDSSRLVPPEKLNERNQ